jgi:uncharacterized protein YndB with AHSA1/START domain
MTARSVTHATFTIERRYPASIERVFAAFSDPQKKRRWFGEDKGAGLDHFEADFSVGGFERSRSRLQAAAGPHPAGTICANDTVYLDIMQNQRIVLAYTMTIGGKRISASQSTFELLPAGTGTQLIFTEQAAFFEGSDGPEMRQGGWEHLLGKLAEELSK